MVYTYVPCGCLHVENLAAEFASHRDEVLDSVEEALDNGTEISQVAAGLRIFDQLHKESRILGRHQFSQASGGLPRIDLPVIDLTERDNSWDVELFPQC